MKYFSINELTRSSVAVAKNIDNTPNDEQLLNIQHLITNLLDVIREIWGGPIIVNSGFRNEQLNKAVGGVPTSNHLNGEAADITTGSIQGNLELFEKLSDIPVEYDEIINEKGGKWLHVALRRNGNNRKKYISLN